jgi:glutamate-1-semialdehyde aminotransferase
MFDEVLGGVDISQRPERYVAIDKAKVQIQKRAQDLVLLSKYNDPDSVKKILNRYPKANAFVPLKANAGYDCVNS